MKYSLIGLLIFIAISSKAQVGLSDDMSDTEDELKASTKQVNQFFRRFNGEEDVKGNRLYPEDKKYRDDGLRVDYLKMLFDNESSNIPDDLKKDFIKQVTDRKSPSFINLRSKGLMAEVNAVFQYQGKKVSMLMYMRIQQQGQGYEWIIEDIAFDGFKSVFYKDTSATHQFIHPMSHELDFMNLRKAFTQTKNPEQYTQRSFSPDYLTLFLFEMKSGNLKFETIKNVKFHFFEIEGWYFEFSKFNRPGYNSGWLISNLSRANTDQKILLKEYIYDKK